MVNPERLPYYIRAWCELCRPVVPFPQWREWLWRVRVQWHTAFGHGSHLHRHKSKNPYSLCWDFYWHQHAHILHHGLVGVGHNQP